MLTRMIAVASLLALFACAAPLHEQARVTAAKYDHIPRFEPEEDAGRLSPPRTIRRVPPEAPSGFRPAVAEATVEAVINRNGDVVDAWYVEGNELWARSVITAVRQWKFEPATLDGKPVEVRFRLSSTFESKGVAPFPAASFRDR